MQRIIEIIKRYKYNYQNEKLLQEGLAKIFTEEGIEFKREFNLSDKDIIDFYIEEEKLGIEVKIKGSELSILRQLKRYSNFENIHSLLLISTKRIFVPDTLSDKPCKLHWICQL